MASDFKTQHGKTMWQKWKNYQVCHVEDAGTVWLREIYSASCSPELKSFKQLEKQLNSHFELKSPFNASVTVGDLVIACYKRRFYRGSVRSVNSSKQIQIVEIFFLDYGIIRRLEGESLQILEPGRWTSIPYQAKRIILFSISPVSLHFNITDLQLKLVPSASHEWDPAATNFVNFLFQQPHEVEFMPVKKTSDGSFLGLLILFMKQDSWELVIQSFPSMHAKMLAITTRGTADAPDGWYFKEDIGKLLVTLNFASHDMNTLQEINKILQVRGKIGTKMKASSLSSDDSPDSVQRITKSGSECEGSELLSDPLSRSRVHHVTERNTSETIPNQFIAKGGRGRGMLSVQNADTAVGSCYRKLSHASSVSSSMSSPINSAWSLISGTSSSVMSSLESDNQENTKLSKSFKDIPRANAVEELLLNATDHEKSTFDMPDTTDIPDIPCNLSSRNCESLRSGAICFQKDSGEMNSAQLCTSLSTVNSETEIELGDKEDKGTDFVSPFEGITSASRSDVGRHINLVPTMDTNLFQEDPHVSKCQGSEGSSFHKNHTKLENEVCLTAGPTLQRDKKFSAKSKSGSIDFLTEGEKNKRETILKCGERKVYNNVIDDATKFRNVQLSNATNMQMEVARKPGVKRVPSWVCKQLMQSLQEANLAECQENKPENLSLSCESGDSSSSSKKLSSTEISDINIENKSKDFNLASCNYENTNVDKDVHSVSNHENLDNKRHSKMMLVQRTEKSKDNSSRKTKGDVKHLVNASFMSDCRNVWTEEGTSDVLKDEFSSLMLPTAGAEGPNIAKLFRMYIAGRTIVDEKVVLNEHVMRGLLNSHVAQTLRNAGIKATRLQAYAWPSICRGDSTVIVGSRYSGKTLGYVVPLMSTLIDRWQDISKNSVQGIGAVMIVVCNDWHSAKCAADSIVTLLPDTTPTFKVITAWGGCGLEEVTATKMLLMEGCDILITTPPCLIRLLTGTSTVQRKGINQETGDTPATSLSKCRYLIIDDADLTLHQFPKEVMQLLKWWSERQQNFDRQLVLTSSTWTPALNSLVMNNLDVINPIIISSPGEAAICAQVRTHVHHVLDPSNVLCEIIELIKNNFSNRRNIVFVKNDDEAKKIEVFLNEICLSSISVLSHVTIWELKRIVHQWHEKPSYTLIVPQNSVYHLLHHNLSNADVIFHASLPQKVSKFMVRYAFMVDNYAKDLQSGKSKCESHVVLTESAIQSHPDFLIELYRVCKEIPKPLVELVSNSKKVIQKHKALCYYLKAYGNCPEKYRCRFRHEIHISDIPKDIPRMGEVTFSVVKVLNASRFLVRLKAYREQKGLPKVSLEHHYLTLFLSLQKHYGNTLNHEPVTHAEVGTLCVVKDKINWARAKIDHIDYSKDAIKITVFLIDEGREMTVELNSALVLHPKFSAMPGLIVEVYLCCVKPIDNDKKWTIPASQYVSEILMNRSKNTEFSGHIALALGLTLWLSPVGEIIQIGKTSISKEPLRSQLISNGFGEKNPEHIESLKEKCFEANISLIVKDLHCSVWLERLNSAKLSLNVQHTHELAANDDNVDSNDLPVAASTSKAFVRNDCNSDVRESSSPEASAYSAKMDSSNQLSTPEDDIKDKLYAVEELPLNKKTEVKITFIRSHNWFFIQRIDKLKSYYELEGEIDELCKNWGEATKETVDVLPWDPAANVTPTSYCLAKFSDDSYYRGRVMSDEPEHHKRVFFIDYGETLILPHRVVQPCPQELIERVPAQAVPCCLAHITIPEVHRLNAVDAMNGLADSVEGWSVKAVGMEITKNGKRYAVELECNGDPPKQMWRELVRAGLAIHDIEDSQHADHDAGDDLLSEAYNFLSSIPSMKNHLDDIKRDHEKRNCSDINTNHKVMKTSKDSIESLGSLSEQKNKKRATGARTTHKNVSKHKQRKEMKENVKSHQALVKSSQKFRDLCLHVPPLQAVEGVTRKLNPETSWSQNEEFVYIKIHLIGVQFYKYRLGNSRLTFMTLIEDKFYAIDEDLEGQIDPDNSSIDAKGLYTILSLAKAVKGKWEHLFAEKCCRRWLRAEVPESDSESEDQSDVSEYDPSLWKTSPTEESSHVVGGLPAGLSSDESSSGDSGDEDGMLDILT